MSIPFGWLFFVLVAVVIIAWFIERKLSEYTFFYGILIMALFAAWAASLMEHSFGKPEEYVSSSIVEDTIYIKSASLNSEVSGDFYIGCGHIGEVSVYKFYKIIDDGKTYKLMEVQTSEAEIREVEPDSTFYPKIISRYYTKGIKKECWFVQKLIGVPEETTKDVIELAGDRTIYVPKGTIVEDFSKLNLK